MTLAPFTSDHFRAWSRMLTLDNGCEWEIEGFQLDVADELFAGYREVLAVLPTGNAKTTLASGLALYWCQFKVDARVPIGASASKQARITYEQASGFVRRSPELSRRFQVQDGYMRIVARTGGGVSVIAVYSASDDSGDGIIPDLAIVDEYHRHRDDGLRAVWRDKLTKRQGQMLTISTAGGEDSNPLEELREAAHKLPNVTAGRTPRHTIARSDDKSFAMHEHSLRPGDDVHDMAVVKMANPLAQITVAELQMRHDSPSTKAWQWLRFSCNLRSKGETSAIGPEVWDALREPELVPDRSAPSLAWMDLAWKIDHAAVGAVVWESNERRVIADVVTLPPPVGETEVAAALLRVQAAYSDLRGIVFDPNAGGTQMVQQLDRGEHPLQTSDELRRRHDLPPVTGPAASFVFIEHSQDNAPMSEAAARFDEAVRNGWIVHGGDRACSGPACRCGGLRGHVLNAAEKLLGGERWRYDRPADAQGAKRAKFPIDALTGVLIGHNIAVNELMINDVEPMFAWI